MSDSALVAAMRPKSYGSSTMGVKKSVVATSACVSFNRYTAASSLASVPTSSAFGSARIGVAASSSVSTPGAILQPQPPPWENWVRRNGASAGVFLATLLHWNAAFAYKLAADSKEEKPHPDSMRLLRKISEI